MVGVDLEEGGGRGELVEWKNEGGGQAGGREGGVGGGVRESVSASGWSDNRPCWYDAVDHSGYIFARAHCHA